uniref:PAT1 domain-containing protein n=1 Tax=Panagrellus redivivus TaxID=6233 RepID=A0A7E4ZU04_PANRE
MDDFEFGGVIPDSDEEEIYAAEPTYDAVNDETFGGDIGDIPADLSDFAANSLALKLGNTDLEDEQPCSSKDIRRPEAAERWEGYAQPGLNLQPRASGYDVNSSQQLKAQEAALRSVESLWGGHSGIEFGGYNPYQQTPTKPQLPSPPGKPSGALTLDEIERHQLLSSGAIHFPTSGSDNSNMLHQSHVANAPPGHIGVNRPSPRPAGELPWIQPGVTGVSEGAHSNREPNKGVAVTAEELEAKLLEEFNLKKAQKDQQQRPDHHQQRHDQHHRQEQQHPAHRNDGPPHQGGPPQMPMPPGLGQGPPGFPGGPPMNPMFAAQMMQYQRMMMAMMQQNPNGPPGPPGNPPMMPLPPFGPGPGPNPYNYMMAMAAGGRMPFPPMPPGMPLPPGGMPPGPMGFPPYPPMRVPTPQRSQNATPSPMNPLGTPHGYHQNNSDARSSPSMMTGCTSPNGSTASRNRRRVGMPSKRTITDFACDPYAGFMSKKEREWLIKIQLIQCLGTGEKYVDDYYYTCWKQQNTLQKRPESWKQPKIRGKYYNLEETYPSNYTPPTFSGVLGKPTPSSTSMPRQCFKVLDVAPVDDDDESTVSGFTITSKDANKRRLRTVLLTIENGFMLILECEDLLRRIHIPSESQQCLNDITSKMTALYNSSLDEGCIPMTMVIVKGRRLVARAIQLASLQMKIQIIANVFNTLRKYSRKVSNSSNTEFLHTVLNVLAAIDVKELANFFTLADAERFKDTLAYSSFSQNLIATLLIACAKRGFLLEDNVPTSSIVALLRSERSLLNGLGNTFNEIFSADELNLLINYLKASPICTKGTVATLYLTSALSALDG